MSEKKITATTISLIVCAFIVFMAIWYAENNNKGESPKLPISTSTSSQPVPAQTTAEEQMALIDGNYGSKVKIARYHYLLTKLEKKTGDTPSHIGGMTLKAQEILKTRYGKEVTLLDLLEGVNNSLSPGSKTPFANAIAMYVAINGQ